MKYLTNRQCTKIIKLTIEPIYEKAVQDGYITTGGVQYYQLDNMMFGRFCYAESIDDIRLNVPTLKETALMTITVVCDMDDDEISISYRKGGFEHQYTVQIEDDKIFNKILDGKLLNIIADKCAEIM